MFPRQTRQTRYGASGSRGGGSGAASGAGKPEVGDGGAMDTRMPQRGLFGPAGAVRQRGFRDTDPDRGTVGTEPGVEPTA